jgi:hypothetical protein
MPKNFATAVMAVMVGLLASVPVAAQESGDSVVQAILQAARLPTVTREARSLGVPEKDLQAIFATSRQHRVPAGDLAGLLAVENDAVRQHGPIDNFGAFVQEKLDAGLRGQELAAAIRSEHAARGIGKGRPASAGKPGEHPGSSGSVDKPGRADEHGAKPGGAAEHGDKPGKPGKPDQPGKAGESGKKGETR